MNHNNTIINGLWVGTKLSSLEMLALHSFVANGHQFHLWVYDDLDNDLPAGVILKDANIVIPHKDVFTKNTADPRYKIGKGSFGTFSDLFRYKLLYDIGGWWVDMDVVCLQSFDIESDYYFRAHPLLPMIGNIMKCPPKSTLLKGVYEEVKMKCNENTVDWLHTNQILNTHIQQLQLEHHIVDHHSNKDDWLEIERLIYTSKLPDKKWSFIHFMNEEWRSRNLDKTAVFNDSYLHKLYTQYNIPIAVRKDYYRSYIYWVKKNFRSFKSGVKKLIS